MKRTLSLLLALVLVLGTFSTVFAVMPETDVEKAELLRELGVLRGDGTDLNLEEDLKRRDAVVLLSRLMKAEELAKDYPTDNLPFDDITDAFYEGYLAWAFDNKYAKGISETKFDPNGDLTAQQFATFLLRALGYEVEGEAYDNALKTAKDLGLLADVDAVNETVVKRSIMAVMTFNALYVPMKDTEVTLGEYLELELPGEEPEVPATFELEDVSATNLREVDIVFNKDVDEDSLAKANFLLGTTEATSVELLEDGVTVRAIFSMENQKEYTLKIKSVKSVDEQELKDVEEKFVAFDNTPPVVENVEVFGNRKVVVTFSEPVDETTAKSLANYKINDKLFGAKVDVRGRKVHFELTSRLADGVHTFEVNTNVKDYAGFKVLANKNEIVVAKDDVKPAVASIDKVTQMEVVVTFTEPVEDNFGVVANVGTFDSKETKDNVTYTLKFTSPYLPLSGTEITLKDVTDYYGNKDTIKINVIPEIDLVRPEVVSVKATKQNEIVVEFSKEVNLDGTYTLKTTDETPVEKTISSKDYVVESGKQVKTKVKLVTETLAAGKYTLEIKDVTDITPLKNAVVPVVLTVEVADLTAPTVEKVNYVAPTTTAEGAIYVYFKEKVSADSALNKSNYSYVDGQNNVVVLGSANTMTLLVDEKVVKISLPKLAEGATDKGISSITIVNVEDLAGNKMSPIYITDIKTEKLPSEVLLTNVRATAVNKVVVDVVYGNLNPYTVTSSDFVLKADKDIIYVIDAQYNANNETLTFTLREDLTSQAKYKDKAVTLYVVAQNLRDIYGNKIDFGSASEKAIAVAVDRIVPTLDKVETGSVANRIKFTFSEEVNFDKNQLVVKENGKVISVTTAVYAVYKDNVLVPNVFEVEIVGKSGKTLEVGFPTIVDHIQDTADPKNSLLPTGWFKVKVK